MLLSPTLKQANTDYDLMSDPVWIISISIVCALVVIIGLICFVVYRMSRSWKSEKTRMEGKAFSIANNVEPADEVELPGCFLCHGHESHVQMFPEYVD